MRYAGGKLATLSAILFSALLLAGCGDGAKPGANANSANGKAAAAGAKRIILVTNGNSPFWDACRFGLQAGEKEFKLGDAGLTAVMVVNDGTPKGQIDKLRDYAAQSDVAGVAVSAVDADNAGVAAEMKKLREQGIPVICVDADLNRESFRDSRAYYIGTDNVIGGRALGTAAKEVLKSKGVKSGTYVQFVGRVGSHNARERMNGFKESVGDDFIEVDRMGDDLDRNRAKENVRNAVTNHSDLVALVGIWSYNAPAIVDVVTERNARDKIVIPTFDAEPGAIQHMQNGQIDVMIVQNPYNMGFLAAKLLKALHQKDEATVKEMFPNTGKPDGDLLDTGLKAVVPDENTPLTAEMFKDVGKVEFMKLKDFRDWLAKYDLSGS